MNDLIDRQTAERIARWIINASGGKTDDLEAISSPIAAAILAAKAETQSDLVDCLSDMTVPAEYSNSWQLGYRQCRIDAVALIRKRGEA